MSRLLPLALALTLLLAGCVGQGGTDEEGEPASEPTTQDTPQAAGPRESAPANADTVDSGADAPQAEAVPVEEEGALPVGVRADGAGYLLAVGRMDRWFERTIEGNVTHATLTLDWTPGMGTEELILLFGPIEETNSGSRMMEGYLRLEGPPPLTLDASDLAWDHEEYAVAAWWAGNNPVDAHEPVEFTIEGTITHLTGGT